MMQPEPSKTQLTVSGLSKNFTRSDGHQNRALRDLSFAVKKAEFVCVIGPSGSGKTTLIRCLNHLETRDSGSVSWADGDSSLKVWRRRCATVFQQFNLLPYQSVTESVMMGRLSYKSTWTSLRESLFQSWPSQEVSLAEGFLKLAGLQQHAGQKVGKLSGGQQQRVAIVRALMQQPELLLADEPVSNLDLVSAHAIMDLLKKVNREQQVTVICNLHDISLVREFSSRVIGINQGQIVFDDVPSKLDAENLKLIYAEPTSK